MEEAIQELCAAKLSSYNNGAAATVVTYDILMVFPREVTHIWSSKWSSAKILYLLVRYWGAFQIILTFIVYSHQQDSSRFCQIYLVVTTVGGPIVIITLVHIITVLRLYALYERRKSFLIVVGGLASACAATDFVLSCLMARSEWKSTFLAPSFVPIQGCLANFPPMDYAMVNWGNSVFLSFLLFGLMCIKFRASILRQKHRERRNGSPLVTSFVQGGTIWFFLITAALIVSAVFIKAVQGPLRQAFLPWLIFILSMAGSRLILTLREAAAMSESPSALCENISFGQPVEGTSIPVAFPDGR